MTETTEVTCKREIELEIPAENVQKATDKVARNIARLARIPGFRPGKAPITIVRRRFADDIQGEVLQALVPEYLEKALDEKKLVPIMRPEVDKVEFKDGEPLKFRAVFEVLPEFELGDYKNLQVQIDEIEVGDAQVDKTLEEMRERAATFVPVEDRPAKEGDSVLIKLTGTPPAGGGEPVEAENVMVPLGVKETLPAFTENLSGAKIGETKTFQATYPDDYPDAQLAGKTYEFTAEVQGIKEKKLPDLNDDFAREISGGPAVPQSSEPAEGNAEMIEGADTAPESAPPTPQPGFSTLDELRAKIRESLEAEKKHRQTTEAREKILETLVRQHDFPVPEALIEGQMDTRLERLVHSLSSQGVDPRAMKVDWQALRLQQRDRSMTDVKAELLLDRIATAENIDATDEEVDKEVEKLSERSGESATALRARLTKQGALDRMKSKLRSEKTIDWLYRTARIETTARGGQ